MATTSQSQEQPPPPPSFSSESTLVSHSSPLFSAPSSSVTSEATTVETAAAAATPPRLFAQASKLARMTAELKLHKLTQQTAALERDLHRLAAKTEHNELFRQQHEERMTRIWHEVLAVRAHKPAVETAAATGKEADENDKEARNTAMNECKEHECKEQFGLVKGEISGLRDKVMRMMRMMDGLPSFKEVKNDDIRRRIAETIRSTRRWHHEHKTTPLSDHAFTARYLRKQARRDPRMAIHLQKAIHRRVRRRGEAIDSRSLDDFCAHICWEDVTQTVQHVLVDRADATVRSLSIQSQARS